MELQQHVSADLNFTPYEHVVECFQSVLWMFVVSCVLNEPFLASCPRLNRYLEAMFHNHEVARLNSSRFLYFVILRHKFKMAEWRGDASCTSGIVVKSSYYVENQTGKIKCETYVKWDFNNITLLHVFLWFETHPSSPVRVYVKREFCSCVWWITSNRHKVCRNNIYKICFKVFLTSLIELNIPGSLCAPVVKANSFKITYIEVTGIIFHLLIIEAWNVTLISAVVKQHPAWLSSQKEVEFFRMLFPQTAGFMCELIWDQAHSGSNHPCSSIIYFADW